MQITPKMALEVASHEAVVRQAYKDGGGVWTWSVGLTNASGHNVERYIDNPQPLARCLEVFIWALKNYAEAVDAEFAGHDLTEAQRAAALSFHWNTGGIRQASWCDLWKAGDIDAARRSFMEWRKPASIIPRREAERDLFFDGLWSNTGTMPEYTRLTSRHTPIWSSRREIEVEAALRELLAPEAAPSGEERAEPDHIAAMKQIANIVIPFLEDQP